MVDVGSGAVGLAESAGEVVGRVALDDEGAFVVDVLPVVVGAEGGEIGGLVGAPVGA